MLGYPISMAEIAGEDAWRLLLLPLIRRGEASPRPEGRRYTKHEPR